MNIRTKNSGLLCSDSPLRSSIPLWIAFIFLLLFPQWLAATDTFARCHIGKEKLQWGEACRITLAVYTRTWFTEGVAFPDMSEQNGVLLKPDRSHTSSETIGGERYSVITQDYLYYPLDIGEQRIRFNAIEVHTPSAGEYKGKKQFLSFPEKRIEVHAAHTQNLRLTTAINLKAMQRFEMPDTLRVGDVVMRSLTYTATGIPGAFIVLPEIEDTLNYARTVQEQPAYFTELKNGNVSGRATQKILYQLTDSGTFTLPSIQADYGSPGSKQMKRLTLEGKVIHVLPSLHVSDSLSLKAVLASARNKTNIIEPRKLIYAGIILLLMVLVLFIKQGRKRISRNFYWKILRVSCLPQLYDILYEYARFLHFNNFQELADKDVKLWKCYDELILRLFKEGHIGKVDGYIKLRLFYAFIWRRASLNFHFVLK